MKIAHITDALPSSHKKWGGAEQATLKIIDALKKAGIRNEVLCLAPERWDYEYPFFPVDTLEKKISWRLSSAIRSILPFDWVAYLKIKKILKNNRPNAVHIHNVSEISLAAIFAASSLGIKIFLSIYDYWYFCPKRILIKEDNSLCRNFHGGRCRTCYKPQRLPRIEKMLLPLRRRIFDHFLDKVDKFIVLSEASADLLGEYGISKERLAVISVPVESVFENYSCNGKNIVFAGWLSPHKGLHKIIEALPAVILAVPDARVIVSANGGDAGYKEKIKTLTGTNKVNDRVKIFDKSIVSLKELARDAALVVIPEQWENMSPVLMFECALSGIPMVLSRVGGIPEFISDEKFLADREKTEEWSEKIIWILKNQAEAGRIIREKIKPKIESIINIEINIENLINLYRQ